MNASAMHIKPATGLKVRDPDLRDFLPDEGRVVPDTGYWRRRLRDGDVLPVEFAAPEVPATPDVPPDAPPARRPREPRPADAT